MTETQSPIAVDPVCHMDVDPATTKYASEYRRETFFFCSLMCRKAFEDDPRHYLDHRRTANAAAWSGR